ncbi:hypothetical protein [Streptomyces sp. NPDC017949]|uniref:hypothetical protein n=1 Tax=Streptomyces sp. NPDC017949 TaxID=3365020 RepID=UPI00378D2D3A
MPLAPGEEWISGFTDRALDHSREQGSSPWPGPCRYACTAYAAVDSRIAAQTTRQITEALIG